MRPRGLRSKNVTGAVIILSNRASCTQYAARKPPVANENALAKVNTEFAAAKASITFCASTQNERGCQKRCWLTLG